MSTISETLKELVEKDVNSTLFIDVYVNTPIQDLAFFDDFSHNIETVFSRLANVAEFVYNDTEDAYYRYIDFYIDKAFKNSTRGLVTIKMHRVNKHKLKDSFSLIQVREKESSDILYEEKTKFLSINGAIGYVREYIEAYLVK